MEADEKWQALFVRGRMRTFSPGEFILWQGEPGGDVLKLIDGWVVATNYHQEDAEIFLGLRGRGQFVGEMSAIGGRPRNATVRAVCHSKAAVVSMKDFLEHVDCQRLYSDLLQREYEEKLATRRWAAARRLGVDIGLSRLLLDLTHRTESRSVRGLPQAVIAALLEVHPRTLRRGLERLVKRGAVVTRKLTIDVTNKKELRGIADQAG